VIQYIMWIIAFLTLYISILWISFLYLSLDKVKAKAPKILPKVTIAVPAYNEERTILNTIKSILDLNYPRDKLEVIIINDGSKDDTKKIVESFIKSKNNCIIINKVNGGKAAALNSALDIASGDLFACVDADSFVTKDSLINALHNFSKPKVAAVISSIQINDPKTIFEKIQRIEYIMAVLIRKLMASINTLSMTPGVLSIYRTKVLKKIGGFDDDNITEDYEIAMRLRKFGYKIEIETDSLTYTNAPSSFWSLWRQRVRWYRGFLFNHVKYRKMFFDKRYSFLAYFQLPLDIIGVVFLLAATSLISYAVIKNTYEFIVRSVMIKDYFVNHVLSFPTLKDFILTQNLKIMIPIWVALIAGIYLFYKAHKLVKHEFKHPFSIWSYFVLLPYLTSLHWISAISHELFRTKRKW